MARSRTQRIAFAALAAAVSITGFAVGTAPNIAHAASCTEQSGEVYDFNHIAYGSGYLQLDLSWALTTNNYCSHPIDTMEVINNFTSSVKDLFDASHSVLFDELVDDNSGAVYETDGRPTMYNPSDPYSGYLEGYVLNWPTCQGGAPCTATAYNSFVSSPCANSLIDSYEDQQSFVIGPASCRNPVAGEGALSVSS